MKNRKIVMATSILSIAAAGLLAVNLVGNSSMSAYLLKSTSYGNSVSIIRTSGFDGDFTGISSVTATTEKGNSLEFGANHFDVRNNYGTAWNDCLVFCTKKGQSTLWNKTELYGITSIKIYSYDSNNPDSYSNLCTASFTFYYGYEMIDFDDEYYAAKQTTSSGKIEFAAGYEPSYFGIECHAGSDLCVSKIEVNYQCEQISGELVTYDEAQGYYPEGDVFKYTSGNEVVVREVEPAPLSRETLALESPKDSWYGTSSYDVANHTWMNVPNPKPDTGSELGDSLTITRSDGLAFPGRTGRDTILVTFMISKGEGFTGWSGTTDIYLGVNKTASGTSCQSRFSSQNPTAGATAWTVISSDFVLYDYDSGVAVSSPWWDKKVTAEFDVSSVANIYNVAFGTSNAYVKYTFFDISFRDDCSHVDMEGVSTGYSFGHRCHRCHKFLEQYVDQLEYENFSGKSSDNFTYETGVSFGGFEDCLKTTTPVKTNNAEGGWSQNYQLRLKGLIANARAAGLTTIKFKTYIQAPVNTNIRFLWGLWNGSSITSVGQFDHYNGPIRFAGNDLAHQMVTSITLLDGSPAGDAGRTNAGRANVWLQVTMDISSSDYVGQELFFSPAVDSSDQNHYPINVYFANLQLLANA